MKKATLILSFLFCVLLVLSLASCGKSEAPPHDHVWGAGTVTVEGDCDTQRETVYTCTICDKKKTELSPGHDFREIKVLTEANCIQDGLWLYYNCRDCGHSETKVIPMDTTAHKIAEGEGRIVTAPTATKDGEIERVCTVCGKQGEITPITYAEYTAEVNALKDKVSALVSSNVFGSASIRESIGTQYSNPEVYPTDGQHPRVLLNSEDLADIKAELYDLRSVTAANIFREAIADPFDGVFTETALGNYSEYRLNLVQMLALDYLLSGNEISGYNAIYAIKNLLKTMDYDDGAMGDMYHIYYGYTMHIAACVYDWCYDLLTDEDRDYIVLGVQEKICRVIGFPPDGDPVTGHWTRYRILRDYLSFAIAIYDEYPDWWEYVGGRFYEEYVPVREEWYKAGMVPQGVSLYIRGKYSSDLFSAWLIEAMSGTYPYDYDNMKQVARTIFSYQIHDNVGFDSGDDHAPDGSFIDHGLIALYSSSIFNDSTMRAQLESAAGSYTQFYDDPSESADHFSYASPAEYLICSGGVTAAESTREGMPLILYNGGWLGQIIARDSWGKEQVAVLMKIGCRTIANHDHYDAGQFQIYYKDVLAGDTGAYVKYGEAHHKYYHQATIAHNSLLIYNPSLKSTDGGKYSGGQKRRGDANLSNWLTSTYKTGELSGVSYGYADEAMTDPTYAYIAGDIVYAYDSSVATEVTRRMLAVFDTGNPDVPMFFFVFDNIAAKNASYKKTFLLHTRTEPIISGNTVKTSVGGGTLVLQNVVGNKVTITAVGGEGNDYNVNGSQLAPENGRDDRFWGRVEISPATGNKKDQLLNVMYVCSDSKDPNLVASAIETSVIKGAQIGNTAAIFVIEQTRRTSTFSFTSTGTETLNYYISGVAAGEWTVSVGGTTLTATATEEGGFLTFSAPAGTVTLTPNN